MLTGVSGGASSRRRSCAAIRSGANPHGPTIAGPTRWHPGPVRIAASSRLPDQELVLLHFLPGYGYAKFQADGALAQGHTPSARTALARIFAHTIFDGGVNIFPSTPASFTGKVQPGTYYLGELVHRPELTPIHVAGPASTAQTASQGIVTATDAGYRLAATLPAHGTITIRNAGKQPHRLNLIPIKRGTTRAQLAAYIRKTGGNDNAPAPTIAIKGAQLGTSDISPNRQMQLTYDLPAGEYAILDFNHDMTTGRPDTLEGMYAVVTLR